MPAALPSAPDLSRVAPACCRLSEQVEHLEASDERLQHDNERLCRVLDSGDWGRQRVQELVDAGRVLQEERDALLALVEGLRGNSAVTCMAAPAAQPLHDVSNSPDSAPAPGAQLHSVSAAGILHAGSLIPACRPGTGGSPGASAGLRPASRPTSPSAAARNKLLVRAHPCCAHIPPTRPLPAASSAHLHLNQLIIAAPPCRLQVRTGSSFNAMVRALKQDLVATGALQRGGPASMLEVDKVRGLPKGTLRGGERWRSCLPVRLLAYRLHACVANTTPDLYPPPSPSSLLPQTRQLSLNRLTVVADGGVEVQALGSPDRRGVAFGRSYPASPPRLPAASGVLDTAPADPSRQSGTLLAAALRLQGIGGRSVGLRSSRP